MLLTYRYISVQTLHVYFFMTSNKLLELFWEPQHELVSLSLDYYTVVQQYDGCSSKHSIHKDDTLSWGRLIACKSNYPESRKNYISNWWLKCGKTKWCKHFYSKQIKLCNSKYIKQISRNCFVILITCWKQKFDYMMINRLGETSFGCWLIF